MYFFDFWVALIYKCINVYIIQEKASTLMLYYKAYMHICTYKYGLVDIHLVTDN